MRFDPKSGRNPIFTPHGYRFWPKYHEWYFWEPGHQDDIYLREFATSPDTDGYGPASPPSFSLADIKFMSRKALPTNLLLRGTSHPKSLDWTSPRNILDPPPQRQQQIQNWLAQCPDVKSPPAQSYGVEYRRKPRTKRSLCPLDTTCLMDRLSRPELQQDNAIVSESPSPASNEFPPPTICNAMITESAMLSSDSAHAFRRQCIKELWNSPSQTVSRVPASSAREIIRGWSQTLVPLTPASLQFGITSPKTEENNEPVPWNEIQPIAILS